MLDREMECTQHEADSLDALCYQTQEITDAALYNIDGADTVSNFDSFGATGIDTIKLFYPVRPLRRPDFHLVRHQMERGNATNRFLWRDPTGQWAWAAMAVRRIGAMRFRIAPIGTEIRLRAFFSVPRVVYGQNSRAIDKEQLQSSLETMEAVLYDLGLQIDWREGQISRLDVHRDVLLPRPFHYYLAALRLLEPRYGRLFGNYPSGVIRGAVTRMVYNLYDKGAERKYRGCTDETDLEEANEAPFNPSWLRLEARLPTASAVRDNLGFETAGSLVDNFEQLPDWLDNRLSRDLFHNPIPEHTTFPISPSLTYSTNDELWWYSQIMGCQAGFKDRLALIGLKMAYETLGQERFWQLAKEADFDTTLPISKLRKHFRETAMNSFSDEMVPVAQLYSELIQSICSPAAFFQRCLDENHPLTTIRR